jgi:hypothetical protein
MFIADVWHMPALPRAIPVPVKAKNIMVKVSSQNPHSAEIARLLVSTCSESSKRLLIFVLGLLGSPLQPLRRQTAERQEAAIRLSGPRIALMGRSETVADRP